jgi:hypothetical protein
MFLHGCDITIGGGGGPGSPNPSPAPAMSERKLGPQEDADKNPGQSPPGAAPLIIFLWIGQLFSDYGWAATFFAF